MELDDAGRNSDNSPLWVKLKAYRWYEPSLWLLLISAPSPLLRSDHRRRARLFSLILFVILVVGIIINSLVTPASQQFFALLAANICLSFAYLASRTRHYKLASSASVFLLWALTIVSVAFNALNNTYEDVTVTDPTNWLFLPALYCVCAVFLSRTGTVSVVVTDFVGCMVLPFIVNTSYFSMRKFLFFHCAMDVLLLLASIIHFRDKLQLYYSAQGISDPEAHMESRLGRLLVRPHDAVSDRILRRRTRILSLCLLILIPANILWCISEFRMNADTTVIGLSVGYLSAILILYALSRSPLYKWSARATLAAFLLFPYFFTFCPSTTPEGAMFANLLANSAAAVLGIALLAGEDLVTLAAIIFFPTIYSPFFPPHVAMSIMLLAAALISRDEHEELVSAGDTTADIPEDEDASNQKMYFGGRFTYLQAARYSFFVGFLCCFVLGLTPLVSVLNYDGPQIVNSKAALTSENAANYRMYITVGHCPTELPQQYTVIGSSSRLYYTYEGALVENTVNLLNLRVAPYLGSLKMISVTLGSGDWKLGQNEVCEILNIQILDVTTNSSVATNSLPPLSATTDPVAQSRKFATQNNQGNSADDDNSQSCPMVTSRNTCGSPAQVCSVVTQVVSAVSALLCWLRGDCSKKGTCSMGICTCNNGFLGANCELSWSTVCATIGQGRSDDGSCAIKSDPTQGLVGSLFTRDTPPVYADSVGSLISVPSSRQISQSQICLVGNTKISSLYQPNYHNVWAHAFLNFAFDDIADFQGDFTFSNSYPIAGDPKYRIYREPYTDGISIIDRYADLTQCASTCCSCKTWTCGKSNQTVYRPRFYLDAQTPSLDGSGLYGAGTDRCSRFRTTSGGLFLSAFVGKSKYLAKNTDGSFDLLCGRFNKKSMYMIGDRRGNANPLTIALHTLFMLNHNRIAQELKSCLSSYTVPNTLLFDASRLLNIAQLHQVLRELLGTFNFDAQNEGSKCTSNSNSIVVSLETTLFMNWFDGRPDTVETSNGCAKSKSFSSLDVAFNTSFFETEGLENIVQGALKQKLVPGVAQTWCNFNGSKIGRPENLTDIGASLIEMARDLGLGFYNDVRAAYCLQPLSCSDPTFSAACANYGSSDASKVELSVGLLYDNGELARRIFLGALSRLVAYDGFQPTTIQKTLGSGTWLGAIVSKYTKNNQGSTCVQSQVDFLNQFTFKVLIAKNLPGVTNVQNSAFKIPNGGNPNQCPGNSETLYPTPIVSTSSPTSGPTISATSLPTTSLPTTSLPTTSLPTTSLPTTSLPTTSLPTTSLPTTAKPSTVQPTSFPSLQPTRQPTSPTLIPTSQPTISSATFSPTTRSPTSRSPTSQSPTTASPTTTSPTTSLPTKFPTASPTTFSPSTTSPTASPTTVSPTTSNPTTVSPTTANPTTSNPTTSNPTTVSPTTANPTTSNPTTSNPTTSNPTTTNPTTSNPTTQSPTTFSPTRIPTTATPTREPTTHTPVSAAPTRPTSSPTVNPVTKSPSRRPSTSSPSTVSPTRAPSTQTPTFIPTKFPSLAPTSSFPTQSPTTSPVQAVQSCPRSYGYDGRCNKYNIRQLNLQSQTNDLSKLPTVPNLSDGLFGNASNADRGASRLTLLSIAYARFFLSDVLEVSEDNMVKPASNLYGCNSAIVGYGAIVNATNYQTPVMDLSNIFGISDSANGGLKDTSAQDRLSFVTVLANNKNMYIPDLPAMIGTSGYVFLSGSANSNVDHYSVYLHSRFYFLHSKFVTMLNVDCPPAPDKCQQTTAVFESARIFVVMVAETIARDLARELGTLPVGFDFSGGIPSEFLLMSFIDRFPSVLPLYGDTNRIDDDSAASALCAVSNADYYSTLYDNSRVSGANTFNNAVPLSPTDNLAWVGYSSMFTVARNGGFLSSNIRCAKTGYGKFQSLAYDPIATVIQRGRDNLFPSCQQYRLSKGLPAASFSDFGNAAFAKQFSALYANNFSAVELSVCMLLDGDLRDRMMGSLINGVLQLQNSTNLCNTDGTPNFASTPVSYLTAFSGNDATSGTQLALILQALCRPSPKIDLRGLTMLGQLPLNYSGSTTIIKLGDTDANVDRFISCTTANPFVAANSKYIPTRAILKEGNPAFCDWSTRDPLGNGSYLSNAGVCNINGTKPPAQNTAQETRRCFCLARDGCSDRGVPANDKSCSCDVGYNRLRQANVLCERPSYPQTYLGNQFATIVSSSPACSIYYNNTPPIVDAANYTSPLPQYCTVPQCSIHEGHYLTGACNDWTKPDLGRIYSVSGRIVPANYPNGTSYAPEGTNWSQSFVRAYPANLTLLPQNALFRGMGKLLVDDAFLSTYAAMNESGVRSGSNPSNPSQFKNMLTGWLDESLVFPIPVGYGAQTFGSTSDFGGVDSYPIPLTDGAEMGMRELFAKRYVQIYNSFLMAVPCSNGAGNICDRKGISRCAREIAISEYRSIAREFLAEAKTLFPGNTFAFSPSADFVAPVELGAAKIFDLHFASPDVPSCLKLNNTPATDSPDSCLQNLSIAGLWTQRDLNQVSAANINTLVSQTKILGVGSLNAYLKKLNQPEKDYSLLSDNLLSDLHGSAAEYAINFGILESILNLDQRNGTANATCLENNYFGNSYDFQFANTLRTWIGPSSTRTLCGLFQSMTNPPFSVLNVGYHPNMFRVGAATMSC